MFQRDATGVATIPLRFQHRLGEVAHLRVAVVDAATRLPLPGHVFVDHEYALPAAPSGAEASVSVLGVPAGSNHDLELRLIRESDGLAVAGDSGGHAGAEPPTDEVHLFGNDGI